MEQQTILGRASALFLIGVLAGSGLTYLFDHETTWSELYQAKQFKILVDERSELLNQKQELIHRLLEVKIQKLVAIDQYALNNWACNLVNKQNREGGDGCYDWCNTNSYQHVTVKGFDYPLGLGVSDEFSHDIQNACAIVMFGGEF